MTKQRPTLVIDCSVFDTYMKHEDNYSFLISHTVPLIVSIHRLALLGKLDRREKYLPLSGYR